MLVTGGTGSLGRAVVSRLLADDDLGVESVTVFSRDEAKQHDMRLANLGRLSATDEVILERAPSRLAFQIGDVRDSASLRRAVRNCDVVIHAAAMKQVPTCELFPEEAIRTNVLGTLAVIEAVASTESVHTMLAVSTDKACNPASVMGLTKATMERLVVQANIANPRCRHIAVRYGNVIASRGSVLPLFVDQVRSGGPLTITHAEMTRFFISLGAAVQVIFSAIAHAKPGEIFIPRLPSVRMVDLAKMIIGDRPIAMEFTGVRPGEKIHEEMVSWEESRRTVPRDGHLVIQPMLPQLNTVTVGTTGRPYASDDDLADPETLMEMFEDLLRELEN